MTLGVRVIAVTSGKDRNGNVGDGGGGGSNCIGTLTTSLRVGSEIRWTRDHIWKILPTVVMLKNGRDIMVNHGLCVIYCWYVDASRELRATQITFLIFS